MAETGYAAVEIAPFTLAPVVTEISPAQRREIRAQAAQAGLEISGIHWVLAHTEGFHLTHPEKSVRDRTARYFEELVRFCAEIGGESIVVGSPKQRQLEPGVDATQGRAWAAEVFAPAVRQAEASGVTLCLEPLAPSETNFINTAAEAISFVEPFGSKRFKIILDVKAMCSEDRPIPEIIRSSRAFLAYFHANDRNLKGPGFGEVDFRPILGTLVEVGYQGYVSVEVFRYDEGPEVIARQSLQNLRAALPAPAPAPR